MIEMEFLNSLCAWSVRAIDYPLGWLLWLSRDVTLLLFAAGTALLQHGPTFSALGLRHRHHLPSV